LPCSAADIAVSPPVEGMAMTLDVKPILGGMNWLFDRRNLAAKALLLAVVVAVGFFAWLMPSGPSDAQSNAPSGRSPAVTSAQDTSWLNPAMTPTEASLAVPAQANAPAETASLDGLKISSQSWRRGGLGSRALVTFTLRNGNDFAVKDIEISCAFARRDGSHLTDRTRLIHDTVNMKSRKTFARMHVGFVNINADKAKCALVAANRI
jgi:hypothetical protein